MSRISVICAAHNMEGVFSFRKSIESIIAQTCADIEIIICDDGSTDGTLALLNSYASRDRRIRIISNSRNMGLAASLNRCATYASCEYLARHDLDDISHPNRLERQIAFMEKNESISLLGTGVYLFDGGGVYAKRAFPSRVKNEDFLFSSPYMHGSVMMRKSAFCSVGGYRVSSITRRTEDYDLFMRMQSIGKGANLDEKLYYYLEDEQTRRRRKYRYRIDEAIVRAQGFRRLGLLPQGIPYIIKPLIVGLLPRGMLEYMKKKYYKE